MEMQQKFDHVEQWFRASAHNILVVAFGLLPLIFIPTVVAPLGYTKAFIITIAIFIALVAFSLSVLRTGTISFRFSLPIYSMWALVGVLLVSSLLSGDFRDSLYGDFFSTHTTLFVALLALVSTILMLLRPRKSSVIHMYLLLALSTLILVFLHILRLIFGAEPLSFGVFTAPTSSPIGSWNDLALFLGLTIILSLVALEQLTVTRVGRILFTAVTAGALIMLAAINFFAVWIVLGTISLVLVISSLRKGAFTSQQLPLVQNTTSSPISVVVALAVFIVSILFVIGGSTIGGWLANMTNVSYVEVRPSFEATTDIARSVYQEQALLGVGPNKFADAWRLHKDASINQTIFWDTNFNAGSGYIVSFFVTAGILGGIAWLLFLGTYLVYGMRQLFRASSSDKIWYFVAVSSYVSALYIWGMSLIHVPGTAVLLLGALFTGISLYAFHELSEVKQKELTIRPDSRAGFVLTLGVIVVIVGSVSALYTVGRHYGAIYTFNNSVLSTQEGKPLAELEQSVLSAFTLSSSDLFARRIAEYQLIRLNSLANTQNPTEAQTQEFNDAMVNGVQFGQEAVRLDPEEPANWSTLASIYNVLAVLGVEGAEARLLEALEKIREFDPQSPRPYLDLAVIAVRGGDIEGARSHISEALSRKSNYTDALYLLAQIELAEGNVDAAISSTRSVIALEPQNATHYYQLGLLLLNQEQLANAASVLEQAIAIDPNYANARYMLGLSYDELGRTDDALEQFKVVLALNPDNATIQALIETLEQGGSAASLGAATDTTVEEETPLTDGSGNVSVETVPESDLIVPVNTPADTDVQ